jgi:adenylate kinase family enzyme
MKIERIWIFGGVGSGKTTLANKISEKLELPHYSTDDFVYKKKWSEKYSKSAKIKKLGTVSKKTSWVIEGVPYSDWIKPSIKKADLVIFLKMNRFRLSSRIIKRQRLRMKNKEDGANFSGSLGLIKQAIGYRSGDYEKYRSVVNGKNFIVLRNPKQVDKFLEELK